MSGTARSGFSLLHLEESRRNRRRGRRRGVNPGQSRSQVRESLRERGADAEKLRESANATEANVSATWNDMQETLNAHIAKARQNIGEKKAEIDVS